MPEHLLITALLLSLEEQAGCPAQLASALLLRLDVLPPVSRAGERSFQSSEFTSLDSAHLFLTSSTF